jgi:hypothetical protein
MRWRAGLGCCADEGGAHIARQIDFSPASPHGVFLGDQGRTYPWCTTTPRLTRRSTTAADPLTVAALAVGAGGGLGRCRLKTASSRGGGSAGNVGACDRRYTNAEIANVLGTRGNHRGEPCA